MSEYYALDHKRYNLNQSFEQEYHSLHERERELYAYLGAFIVEFEGLMQNIRYFIQNISSYKLELGEKVNPIYIEILVHDSQAKNLHDYLKAYLYEILGIKFEYEDELTTIPPSKKPDTPAIIKNRKLVTKLCNPIKEALELRNTIAHGSWELSSYYGHNLHLNLEKPNVKADYGFTRRGKLFKNPHFIYVCSSIRNLSLIISKVGENIGDDLHPFHDIEEVDFKKIGFDLDTFKFTDEWEY